MAARVSGTEKREDTWRCWLRPTRWRSDGPPVTLDVRRASALLLETRSTSQYVRRPEAGCLCPLSVERGDSGELLCLWLLSIMTPHTTIPPRCSLCFLFADPFLFLSAPWGRSENEGRPTKKGERNAGVPVAAAHACTSFQYPSVAALHHRHHSSSEALESSSRSAVRGLSSSPSVRRHLRFFTLDRILLFADCHVAASAVTSNAVVVSVSSSPSSAGCALCSATFRSVHSRLCLFFCAAVADSCGPLCFASQSCRSLFASRVAVLQCVASVCVRESASLLQVRWRGAVVRELFLSASCVSASTRASASFRSSQQTIQELHLSRHKVVGSLVVTEQ